MFQTIYNAPAEILTVKVIKTVAKMFMLKIKIDFPIFSSFIKQNADKMFYNLTNCFLYF